MSSIHNIPLALVGIYVFVCDYLAEHPNVAAWRHSNNDEPDFTDAEVITIALMQGCLGCATLKKAYLHIAHNYADAFPHLCSYQRWIARLHALQPLVGRLVVEAAKQADLPTKVYVVDSKPIPVCKEVRHGRVRLLRDDGAYFGKNSVGWYFGFKLHVLMHKNGTILHVLLTSASVSDKDRNIVCLLCSDLEGGLVLGDEGYRSQNLRALLKKETGTTLFTPPDVPKERRHGVQQVRKRIETRFSQLWSQFIDRVFSRSWQGLWNTILLKLLHYNLGQAHILTN
jgi:hypothetical protein